jgi:uncharacterized protein YraI
LSGQWSACAPPYGCPYVDANGDQSQWSENASLGNVIRGCYHGALIARIGTNYPFCVGASYSTIIQDSGPLLLSINDKVLSDDGGEITVQIVITGPTSTPILINQPTTTKTIRLSTWTKTPSFTTEPKIKILTPAFIRSGPSTVYGKLTSYKNGTELTVIGRNQDCTWLVVTLPDNRNGWIATSLIETNLNIMDLPVIQAPSTPIPNPTQVPEQKQPNYPTGDMNHDCVVDDADYAIWVAAYGSSGSKIGDPNYNPAADLNSDGVVDGLDYVIWANHYGEICN